MMNVILTFGTLMALLLAGGNSIAQERCAELLSDANRAEVRTFDASQSLSQKIRDNSPHYWEFSRVNGKSYFAELLNFQGLIVGDTHAGNFIVSRLAGKMQFFIADIKDSGQGPFILDFSRLVLSTHAYLKGHVKMSETAEALISAYKSGLSGAEYKIPKSIRWIFEQTLNDYSKAEQTYVESKVKKQKFKLKEEKLEEISFSYSDPRRFNKLQANIEKAVQESIPDAEILDLAFRPRERGGSVDMARYWALVRTDGQLKILEFKQVSVPSTANYTQQQETFARYERIFKIFWQVTDPLFKLTKLDGDIFLMRPKKSDVFRVKYSSQSKKDIEFGLQLAAYDAYYLGTLHGRQLSDQKYQQALDMNKKSLIERIKKFNKDYMEDLKKSLEYMQGKAL